MIIGTKSVSLISAVHNEPSPAVPSREKHCNNVTAVHCERKAEKICLDRSVFLGRQYSARDVYGHVRSSMFSFDRP